MGHIVAVRWFVLSSVLAPVHDLGLPPRSLGGLVFHLFGGGGVRGGVGGVDGGLGGDAALGGRLHLGHLAVAPCEALGADAPVVSVVLAQTDALGVVLAQVRVLLAVSEF